MTYNGAPARYTEPPIRRVSGPPSNGRWGWWYSAIADAMIRHPDKQIKDIALDLNKHPNTVSMIINTDMFKEYLAQRKAEWRQVHDHALRAKLTDVASESLDIVLEQLKTKRTQIPFNAGLKVMESALDRLGYAPATAPTVVVNNSTHDNRQINGLSAHDLEEARAALRQVEQARIGTSLPPSMCSSLDGVLEQEAGLDVSDVVVDGQIEEVNRDPPP